MSQTKKIILVTGANKGIGFEIVKQLATLNHTVILTARNETRGLEAIHQLKKQNLAAHFFRLDVTDATQREGVKKEIEREFGRLDVLVNNAGIGVKGDKSLVAVKTDVWNETMATNAEGPLMLANTFIPLMPKGSRIINMSSGGGSMSDAVEGWSPVYCISKSTLNAITRQLAFYLTQSGISVNAMCPGWVKTDMGTNAAPRSVEHGADTAVWLATADNIPSGKFWRDRKIIPW
jgi:NAD(P)-dependent dehydrogenase (short-subunit alcohol dehydrogenase family)